MSLKSVLAFLLCVAPATVAAQSVVPVPAANATTAPNTRMVDTVDRVVAVVGSSVITWSDLAAAVNEQRAAGLKLPDDPAGQLAVARGILNDLVDQEILIQKAKDVKVDVTDAEVTPQVDAQIKQVRSHFQSDIEYRNELKNAGFGSPEEYRRTLFDKLRRDLTQRKTFAELQKTAKPASVTEEEVTAAYDKVKDQLKKRPAMIAFRQIVIAPHASKFADSVALAKAESLLVQLKKGANFEEMAKRESMDPGTKNVGGDLGWNRRGSDLVPQFEAVMFSLRPGELSPIVKTSFGYHIIRVDRVQPAEVKARHILIAPVIDSNDVHLAYLRADSVANLWRKGANFDSLVAKYHDPAEEKGILQPYPLDSLPASYKAAVADLKVNDVSAPFPLVSQNGSTKYAIVQIVTKTAEGEYSLPEMRENIRKQLADEKQARALLDELRKQTYVSLRL
ncbi:MAG TPA: peptidylprolyl isomerase [Gemmatimonadaceae bacterium]|nr:peptidylprolyl isomerase [Gemmatimonadaceae bacterium]